MDIHIYELTKCGFYAHGDKEPRFGGIDEWWDQFVRWVEDKGDWSLTHTFDHPEDVPRRLYCADTVRDESGNFGVALWNEAPMRGRDVAYLPSSGRVGTVRARTRRFPSGSIAGWPTYLWFMPWRSLVVALSPEGFGGYRGSGIRQAREYFRRFLESHSPYALYLPASGSETESEEVFVGYCRPEEERADSSLNPRFETRPLYGRGPLQEILNRREEIRKIVKSYTITADLPERRSQIERALDLILAQPIDERRLEENSRIDRRTFRVESTWRPSPNALIHEIEEWERRDHADNYYVGVYFDGDPKIRRFDKEQGKLSVELEENFGDEPLWTGEGLVAAWRMARTEVEGFLRSVGDEQEVS